MSSSWPVFPWEVQTRPARRVAVLRRHLRAEPQSMGTAESAEGGEAGFPPAAAGPGGPESGLGERGRLGGKTTVSLGAPPPKKCAFQLRGSFRRKKKTQDLSLLLAGPGLPGRAKHRDTCHGQPATSPHLLQMHLRDSVPRSCLGGKFVG